MQGDPEIIEVLNEVLTAELTAINQYFIHAKMRENWGLERLAAIARKESIEEMEDADKVIDRILYLDGVPNMQRYNPVNVGETVLEQLQLELETEKSAIERYNRAIVLARREGGRGVPRALRAPPQGRGGPRRLARGAAVPHRGHRASRTTSPSSSRTTDRPVVVAAGDAGQGRVASHGSTSITAPAR